MENNRRYFLKQSILSATGFGLLPFFVKANIKDDFMVDTPKLDAELVKQFVGVCHGNFEKVKELYAKEPKFIFSSHDWGMGISKRELKRQDILVEKKLHIFY